MAYDEGLLERCLDCARVLGVRDVRHKNVFGMRGVMRGKKMFVAVGEAGMIVKMTKSEFDVVLKQPGVERFMPGDEPLGTWVLVNEDVVADDSDLREWLAAGLRGIQ
ncbi:MAG TPA: TfoX/Sxy family protein [Longimicrobiales bacterium]|nr:TfoX/Sxy family protein [Longimicrobiales bacterium]